MTHPNLAADTAGAVTGRTIAVRRGGWEAFRFRNPEDRPLVVSDRQVFGRWVVIHRGHIYPFASWETALKAAHDPAHLCRYTCICPVQWREAA